MAELYWLGQMGLIIKSKETKICIDYFATPTAERRIAPPLATEGLADVDAFLGTHNHLDHIDHEAWKIWTRAYPKAKFIFAEVHRKEVLNDGVAPEYAIGLNDGESVKVGDMTIHAIAAAHEFLEMDEATGLYPHLQYIVEADGAKIHHAGDTLRYEGMLAKLKAFGHIDAELLPINGRDARRYTHGCIGNMTFQEAADLAGEVAPAVAIPGHWDMFADNGADPKEFADYLEAKYKGKVACRIPKIMERITV